MDIDIIACRLNRAVMRTRLSIVRCIIMIVCVMFTVFAASCTQEISNGLMDRVSPAKGALELYYFDGTTVCTTMLYNASTIQKVVDEFDAVKATEDMHWSTDVIKLPIYGLYNSGTDGLGFFVAWSNNHLITQDGTAYKFKFDFEKLLDDYAWENQREYSWGDYFPCSRFLSQDQNGWNAALMLQASEYPLTSNITMSLESWDADTVSVVIVNQSTVDKVYHDTHIWGIQVLLDGKWYEVPRIPAMYGNAPIETRLFLPAEVETPVSFNVQQYGRLPEGTYRFAFHDLMVERYIE